MFITFCAKGLDKRGAGRREGEEAGRREREKEGGRETERGMSAQAHEVIRPLLRAFLLRTGTNAVASAHRNLPPQSQL